MRTKTMGYNNDKGRTAENETRDFFQELFPQDIVLRFGGIEFQKFRNSGDVGVVQSAKKGMSIVHAKRPVEESPLYNFFIETKCRANPDVWGSYDKAADDADIAGKSGTILYAIKQERGSKGKRLICFSPRSLFLFIQKIREESK